MSKPCNNSNGKGNRRERKPYNARKGLRDRTDVIISNAENIDKFKSNDISWYNKHPEEFKKVTQAPTWWKVYGLDTQLNKIIGSTDYNPITMPIGMRIEFLPGPGTCSEQTDGVNRAFATLMADLYSKSSSSSLPFQQADLAMLTFAVDSVATLIAMAKRALGFANNWVTVNKFYPRGVLKMLGFDYDTLQVSRADFIARLNASIYRFNSLRFPDKFDIIHRHYSMAHNIYADEDSAFAQLYAFAPSGYYKYSDTESKCTYIRVDYNNGSFNFPVLLQTIEDLMDALFNSSDLYLINGALQRAYTEGTFTQITQFSDSADVVTPIVDRTIMGQVMNMDITGTLYDTDITQNPSTNCIIWKPAVSLSTINRTSAIAKARVGSSHFMMAYDSSVSADDNMEFTRLCNTVYINASNNSVNFVSGTEIVEQIHIRFTEGSGVTINSNFLTSDHSTPQILGKIFPFRYLPPLYLSNLSFDSSTGAVTLDGLARIGDIYNYTTLSPEDLDKLNREAMFSIWA